MTAHPHRQGNRSHAARRLGAPQKPLKNRDADEKQTRQIGITVCDVLRECGVTTEWVGDPDATIVIPLLQDNERMRLLSEMVNNRSRRVAQSRSGG